MSKNKNLKIIADLVNERDVLIEKLSYYKSKCDMLEELLDDYYIDYD